MKVLFIALGLSLIGCGANKGEKVSPTRTIFVESEPCSVESTDEGAIITCPDGSSTAVANGSDGSDGSDGNSIQGEKGDAGANGKDADAPSQSILFHGTICNNLNVLGLIGGSKFIAYGNEVFVLSTKEITIWTQTNNTKYCKVKLDEAGSIVATYAP